MFLGSEQLVPSFLTSYCYSDFPGVKVTYLKAEPCGPDLKILSGTPSGKLQIL